VLVYLFDFGATAFRHSRKNPRDVVGMPASYDTHRRHT